MLIYAMGGIASNFIFVPYLTSNPTYAILINQARGNQENDTSSYDRLGDFVFEE